MSELIIELTDEQFEKEIKSSDAPVMVDFWAGWCGPCKMMAPIVNELADDYKGKVKIAKLNVEENQSVASQLGVMTIPTFIFFKDGREVSRLSGVVPKKELTKRLEEMISA